MTILLLLHYIHTYIIYILTVFLSMTYLPNFAFSTSLLIWHLTVVGHLFCWCWDFRNCLLYLMIFLVVVIIIIYLFIFFNILLIHKTAKNTVHLSVWTKARQTFNRFILCCSIIILHSWFLLWPILRWRSPSSLFSLNRLSNNFLFERNLLFYSVRSSSVY